MNKEKFDIDKVCPIGQASTCGYWARQRKEIQQLQVELKKLQIAYDSMQDSNAEKAEAADFYRTELEKANALVLQWVENHRKVHVKYNRTKAEFDAVKGQADGYCCEYAMQKAKNKIYRTALSNIGAGSIGANTVESMKYIANRALGE